MLKTAKLLSIYQCKLSIKNSTENKYQEQFSYVKIHINA